MKNLFVICVLGSMVFASCSTETELKQSVFIQDSNMPGLPIYSEWGYNTFGAYVDRAPFTSREQGIPARIVSTDTTLLFTLEGVRMLGTFNSEPLEIEFQLPPMAFTSFQELVSLDEQSFDLTQVPVVVLMDGMVSEVQVDEGSLEFARAQNLFVDRVQFEVILSGRFDFHGIIDGREITVTDGRFDLGVSDDSFMAVE